ncbi:MAG: hypothetical protein Q9204_002072 [Flavoplaca sp. TL-2023a]
MPTTPDANVATPRTASATDLTLRAGKLEGQGANCFAQAGKDINTAANLLHNVCVDALVIIQGCENTKQWESDDENCISGTFNLLINILAAGNPADENMPLFALGTTEAILTKDAPEPGIAPKWKTGTSVTRALVTGRVGLNRRNLLGR